MHLLLGAQLQQGLSIFRGFRFVPEEPSEFRWPLVLRFDVAEAGVAPGRRVVFPFPAGFAIRAAAAALWRRAVGVGVPV